MVTLALNPRDTVTRVTGLDWLSDTFEPIRRAFFNDLDFVIVGEAMPSAEDSQWCLLTTRVLHKVRCTGYNCLFE